MWVCSSNARKCVYGWVHESRVAAKAWCVVNEGEGLRHQPNDYERDRLGQTRLGNMCSQSMHVFASRFHTNHFSRRHEYTVKYEPGPKPFVSALLDSVFSFFIFSHSSSVFFSFFRCCCFIPFCSFYRSPASEWAWAMRETIKVNFLLVK